MISPDIEVQRMLKESQDRTLSVTRGKSFDLEAWLEERNVPGLNVGDILKELWNNLPEDIKDIKKLNVTIFMSGNYAVIIYGGNILVKFKYLGD